METIEYVCSQGEPEDHLLGWLAQLNQAIFKMDESPDQLASYLETRSRVLICFALVDGEPIGFKAGTDEGGGLFESWRGGILNSYRRRGIATELIRLQHAWCLENGFSRIRTVTNQENTPMLILNLRSGFRIMGTFLNQQNRLKVLLEKCL